MSISQVNAQSVNVRASMAIAALRSNASASATAAAPRQADSVTLSDSARALASAAKAVSDASDVREDKVAAIKAAIASGTYSVDSRSLARSMVKSALK
jgi:negative regulator of flagellin synthesis FlgM